MLFRKEANERDMIAFWQWFAQKESWIIEKSKTDGMSVVEAVDKVLKPVFPYFKKEIEFQLGYNDGKGEFFFYDLHNKNLLRDATRLSEIMPEELRKHWTFIIEH